MGIGQGLEGEGHERTTRSAGATSTSLPFSVPNVRASAADGRQIDDGIEELQDAPIQRSPTRQAPAPPTPSATHCSSPVASSSVAIGSSSR